MLGCALGFVFVPCAGPALAYVTASAASGHFGFKAIAITVAYTIGFSIVLLAVALGGRRVSAKLRVGVGRFRVAFGAVIAVVAFALVFNWDAKLANIPWATDFFQRHTEASSSGLDAFKRGTNPTDRKPAAAQPAGSIPDYGPAPDFAGISAWFNSKPLTLAQLRGKVVLIDFWTYSCINCLRTLPHLEAWDRMYRDKGLVIVGVHTPEFPFEAVPSNVRGAIHRLGVRYPVALDPKYGTWDHWGNQYWPAEYLIDKQGHVRHAHFGEGSYGETERLIRRLLGETPASPASDVLDDTTPTGPISPETYLGYSRIDHFTGRKLYPDKEATYAFPSGLGQNDLAYAGRWKVEGEKIVAGAEAKLRFRYYARKVYIVLGGHGRVQALVDGKPTTSFAVTEDKLYTVVDKKSIDDATLELRFTPGVEAYSFTFG